MFFPESELIAREQPDLLDVVTQVDGLLSTIASAAPLRPGDFACVIGVEQNQVESAFELLAQRSVLSRSKMVECERCHNLMCGGAFRRAVEDEDEFECTTCGRRFSKWSELVLVYQLSAQALSRRPPISPAPTVDVSCDDPLSERAQFVLVAMRKLGAIDSDKRRPTEEIAAMALGGNADANALKAVMSELNSRELVDSKTGRGGGCWLTPKGCVRAAKLGDR